MTVIDSDADVQANALYTSLIAGSATAPTVDLSDEKYDFTADTTSELYKETVPVSLVQLTEVDLKGAGVFDKLMQAVDGHIQREYKGNRITGDQYAKVYTEVTTAVLGQSVSFLLQKDQSKWAAINAQMQARITEIQATEALLNLEKTKVQTQQAVFDMENSGAQYALTKMQIVNADASYSLTQAQKLSVDAQTVSEEYRSDFLLPMELSIQDYTLTNMLPISLLKEQHLLNYQLPAQTNLLKEQGEVQRGQTLDTRADSFTSVSGLIGRQKNLLDQQINLSQEQVESERAKTLDTRKDGTAILGSVGKQKDLYTQQIDSFDKDAKHKVAKMYLDGWITNKTFDAEAATPNELDTPSVSAVLESIRTSNGIQVVIEETP